MTFPIPPAAAPTRRELVLSLGLALGMANTRCGRAAVPAKAGPGAALLPDPNNKFDEQGAVRPWPGDTIVSPLPSCSAAFQTMLQVNREVTRLFHPYVAETPPASYHMTIFGGADPERHARGWWPADIPPDTPIETVDAQLRDRLSRQLFDYPLPIRMVVDTGDDLPDAPAIFLKPATNDDRDALYHLRHQISRCIGIVPPDIDTFRFHVTFGYIFRQMPAPVAAAFRDKLRQWRRLVSDAAVIAFPAPDYCVFADMFAFQPVLRLPRRVSLLSGAGADIQGGHRF